MMPAIEAVHLKKSYWLSNRSEGIWGSMKGLFHRQKQEVEAVKGISLSIKPGELVAFLGPNGAGKTTTLKMMSGLLQPTSGELRVLGSSPFEKKPEFLKRFSFVMGQRHQLWWELPALDTFRLNAAIFGLSPAQYKSKLEELNSLLQLDPLWHTPVKKLSLGQRMKMELACSLLHDPDLLLLDEPTLGLDVMMQKTLRDFIARLNKEKNTTVLLTSHNMEDIETLCRRVIVIDRGLMLFDGDLSALMTQFSASKQVTAQLSGTISLPQAEQYGHVLNCREEFVSWEIPRESVPKQVGLILQGLPVMDLSVEELPLEDVIRKVFLSGKV